MTEQVRGFLDTYWTLPGTLVATAELLSDPMGPDPDDLVGKARDLRAMAAAARTNGLEGVHHLADALSVLCDGLGQGSIDPTGAAGGLLEPGALALEEALILLEGGAQPDGAGLMSRAEAVRRVAPPPQRSGSTPTPTLPQEVREASGRVPAPTLPRGGREESASTPSPPPPREVREESGRAPTPTFEVERFSWEPPDEEMVGQFFIEVEGHIENLQSGLIRLSDGVTDADLVNTLFRASHSIKGLSGQMGAQPLGRVAHRLEDILGLLREGELSLSPASTMALLEVNDALMAMIDQLRNFRQVEHPISRSMAIMDRVARGESCDDLLHGGPAPGAVPASAPPQGEGQGGDAREIPQPSVGASELPSAPETPAPGASPGGGGERSEPPKPPPARGPGPAAQTTDRARPAVQVKVKQYLTVDFDKVNEVMNHLEDLFVNKVKLHEGVSSVDELNMRAKRLVSILAQWRESGGEGFVLGEEETRRLVADVTDLATELESLSDKLSAATGETDMISSDLRDKVMVMRMVPLKRIFRKLETVVFDAVQRECRGRGERWKRAILQIPDEEAEIDKRIANDLEVPLVHIVRNAVAHGLEPVAEREAAGKPASGLVRIEARQQGSQFVIRVSDDGQGMVPARIAATALKRGLADQEELDAMTEKEVLGLIFKAGFTTAEKADDLKGRGVGLDEVMSKIKEIKGSIEVESVVGKGSTITLYLPLTLAINTVIIGEVADETLAVPMSAVERAVRVDESEIEHMGDTEVFTLLAQTVPLVRVDELLAMGRPATERPDACYVIVLSVGDKRFGLAFDKMSGKQDVVVKSLGSLIVEAPLTAGATLLGERCILILDPMDIAANLGKSRSTGSRRERTSVDRIRPRLLLVEDEALTRLKLKRIFEEAGLEVFEAVDGKEAYDAARNADFQMVSTDVIMPRMDGYELTRRLREMPRYRDVPIIMISSKVDRNAGFEAGVDHYLVKPVDRAELLGLVQKVRL